MNKALKAFRAQERRAIERGIEFKFTFEEWVAWWETHLGFGWLLVRGKRRGQYQMVRKKSAGPISTDNVDCIKIEKAVKAYHAVYTRQGSYHQMAKLNLADVRSIRSSVLPVKELAKVHHTSCVNIYKIRSRARWKHVK